MNDRSRIIAVILLAASVILIAILSRDFWMPDEPRYAQVAREMMKSGDYLVPRVNGGIYKEKPPLLFWLQAIASAPVGDINEFTARVPLFLSAIATLILTYALARRMYREQIAILATLILAMSYRFWWQAHFGQIDMLLCACMTLCLYALWRWHESRRVHWLVMLYTGMALGLMAKGPPALLFPLLAAIVFYFRDFKSLRALKLWIGVPAALAVVLIWLIPARLAASDGGTAVGALGSTIYRQVYARIFLGIAHAHPIWYYLENMPIDWLPWTVFAPWVLYYTWKHRYDGPAMRFILSWVVPALVFFTLSSGKRALYLLPTYPAIAILVACAVRDLAESGRRRWLISGAIAWIAILTIVASLPLTAFVPAFANLWRPTLFIITGIGGICIAWTVCVIVTNAWRHLPYAVAFQFAGLIAASSVVVFPIADTLITARHFVAPIRLLRSKGDVLVFSATRVREEYLIYSHTLHRPFLMAPGLSGVDAGLSEDETTQLTERLLVALPAAAASVPAFDPFNPDPVAAEAVRVACERAAIEAGIAENAVSGWSRALAAEIETLAPAFARPEPTMLIVSTRHWPWIRAYLREPVAVVQLTREQVRSIDILLLGNNVAADAWASVSRTSSDSDVRAPGSSHGHGADN